MMQVTSAKKRSQIYFKEPPTKCRKAGGSLSRCIVGVNSIRSETNLIAKFNLKFILKLNDYEP
jgi:hypothetical protein